MNELGNTTADKNYKPSGISRAESRAWEAYPYENGIKGEICAYSRPIFVQGYEQAEKDILSAIESRLSEIIGDAQPKPVLRAELKELINRIKDEKK